jgi:hypothetical protein
VSENESMAVPYLEDEDVSTLEEIGLTPWRN